MRTVPGNKNVFFRNAHFICAAGVIETGGSIRQVICAVSPPVLNGYNSA
jgi:hypothetical protein